MISTSENYNPFPIIRSVGFEVEFYIADVNARGNASITESGGAPVSIPEQTYNGVYRADDYTTLELNYMILDKSWKFMPDDTTSVEIGWWSNAMTDKSGMLEIPPTVRYDFSVDVSSVGFTGIYTYAPKHVQITVYDANDTVMADKTFNERGNRQIYEMPVQNYRSVEFRFLDTVHPYRRIKLIEAVFGIVRTYDETGLQNVSISYGTDHTGQTIAMRRLIFRFDNSNHEYNLLNPKGIYAYLQDGQQIISRAFIGGKAVDMGTFLYSSAASKDGTMTAEIIANDIIYTLDDATFLGGSAETATLSEAVTRLLDGYHVQCNFTGDSGERIVKMGIPTRSTRRDALRMLAQAAMCAVWTDRGGVLQFQPLEVSDAPVASLTPQELYNYDGISVAPKTDGIELLTTSDFEIDDIVFFAGGGTRIESVWNPCVADENGQAVADWLLAQYNRRKRYKLKNRCDPAVELGDTIKVYDAYGHNDNAVVSGIEVRYDGGLSATTTCIGG